MSSAPEACGTPGKLTDEKRCCTTGVNHVPWSAPNLVVSPCTASASAPRDHRVLVRAVDEVVDLRHASVGTSQRVVQQHGASARPQAARRWSRWIPAVSAPWSSTSTVPRLSFRIPSRSNCLSFTESLGRLTPHRSARCSWVPVINHADASGGSGVDRPRRGLREPIPAQKTPPERHHRDRTLMTGRMWQRPRC